MKDWPKGWEVLVTSKKGSKGKKQTKVVPSQKTNNPTTNTRKETKSMKETYGSVTVRNPRPKNHIPKLSSHEKDRTKVTNGGAQKDNNVHM